MSKLKSALAEINSKIRHTKHEIESTTAEIAKQTGEDDELVADLKQALLRHEVTLQENTGRQLTRRRRRSRCNRVGGSDGE